MAKCRSCDAPIEWAEWADSGKRVPLDVAPATNGNLAVVAGKVHRFTDEDARLGRERRVSHFVTCPDAGSWRSR
jgi:hypothetical protein